MNRRSRRRPNDFKRSLLLFGIANEGHWFRLRGRLLSRARLLSGVVLLLLFLLGWWRWWWWWCWLWWRWRKRRRRWWLLGIFYRLLGFTLLLKGIVNLLNLSLFRERYILLPRLLLLREILPIPLLSLMRYSLLPRLLLLLWPKRRRNIRGEWNADIFICRLVSGSEGRGSTTRNGRRRSSSAGTGRRSSAVIPTYSGNGVGSGNQLGGEAG